MWGSKASKEYFKEGSSKAIIIVYLLSHKIN
jgi:hypothetical protein